MIAYLDSSVLLRVLLNQKGKWAAFSKIQSPVSSVLLKTECLRALDRLRIRGHLNERDFLRATEQLYEGLDSVEFVTISNGILEAAGRSFAVALGTLDAIHLVSALYWREKTKRDITFLTHDIELAKAARASGFTVLG